MNDAIAMLGYQARDKITGFEGVVESVCFDLYGCVQVVLRPKVDPQKPTEWPEPRWIDLKRIDVIDQIPIMPCPAFEDIGGPAEKPRATSKPAR